MPKEQSFWFPVHEAGHIIIAMAFGFIPNYAILKFNSNGTARAYTSMPSPRCTTSDQEVKMACGGMAAEILIFRENERHVLEADFISACFNRSRDDRRRFFENVDARSMNVIGEEAEDKLMLEFSMKNALPIIERERSKFDVIRSHLAKQSFIATASLECISQGGVPGEHELALDHVQLPANHPAWNVPQPV